MPKCYFCLWRKTIIFAVLRLTRMTMQYLPINIKLNNQTVLVLGGGATALRKINSLLKANAQITCISLTFKPAIKDLAKNNQIKCIEHDLRDLSLFQQIQPIRLIVSATGVAEINRSIFQFAEQQNILINTVDQQELCTYITPAIIDRSPVVVSISSEGAAPILVRIIKQKINQLLPLQLGLVASKAKSIRSYIKKSIPQFNNRKRFWERYFKWSHSDSHVLPENFRAYSAKQLLHIINETNNNKGLVSLVGAGPGNPDLLTLKAVKVLQTADVVLHDHLISDEIMQMIRTDAELIDVGKRAGNHKTKQQNINQLLADLAKQGLHVCRLKGGDSFVFGRGGEEIIKLKTEGVAYEIIPGITAAVGCAAYAGIPLTHRNHAQSLSFLTAHCGDSIDTIDWQFYAKDKQTLAVYMGLIKAEHLTEQLIKHGKNPDEYVAIIENGTRTTQRTVVGHLEQLPAMITTQQIKSPALIVIGEVAKYAKNLDWYKEHIEHIDTYSYSKTA